MLKTKSILKPKNKSDGLRISIMASPYDYHIQDDGKTRDTRITEISYDLWLKQFAPSFKLIGDYYKRNLQWNEYESRYLDEIRKIKNEVKGLAKIAINMDITLLCIEDSPEHCHRKILAEECKKYQPSLVLDIR